MDDYAHLRLHETETRRAVHLASTSPAKRRTPAARRMLGALTGVVRNRNGRGKTQLSATGRSRRAASA